VTLTAVSDRGTESEVTQTVVVADEDGSVPENTEAETETQAATERATTEQTTAPSGTDDGGGEESETGATSPGFGVGGALAGVAGASYLLGERAGDDADDES